LGIERDLYALSSYLLGAFFPSGLHQIDRADSRTKSSHFVNLIWRDLLKANQEGGVPLRLL
jgi:hypothetical protein